MGTDKVDRRDFLKKVTVGTGAAAAAYSWEEHSLLAFNDGAQGGPPQSAAPGGRQGGRGAAAAAPDVPGPMPTGTLGKFEISRLIAGHNLVVGQAHSRDLLYTSQLLQAYFTEEKILDTFASYEKRGINASFARMSAQMIGPVKKYMKERGGKLHWFAGLNVTEQDQTRDLDMALDMGAEFGYVHGNASDGLFKNKRIDIIGKSLEKMRAAGMVSGVCSHLIDVPMALEKEGIHPDFYVKTFNPGNYWSAGPPMEPDPKWKPSDVELAQPERGSWGNHNNLWDTTPKQTAAFMANVKVPWIGFKVLGAGAIAPREAFKYSFQNGCDFVCAGMYDFQVADNVNVAKQIFIDKNTLGRTRPWHA